ncbi:hypothetical protein KAR91_71065 [Candidatus Pacearchaeota archaeon]|nr:hypothetical protein [Candidatus Pacearchaeota archaeon]
MGKTLFENEEEVVEFFKNCSASLYTKFQGNQASELSVLKNNGILKQTPLEIAEDAYRDMKRRRLSPDVGINDMINYADAVIKEQVNEIERLRQQLTEK